MSSRHISPMRHTGDAANVAFYQERNSTQLGGGLVHCEVLRSDPYPPKRPDGLPDWEAVAGQLPTFHITIYRQNVGKIAAYNHRPHRLPRPGRLPERTVTRLVRRALAELDGRRPDEDHERRE